MASRVSFDPCSTVSCALTSLPQLLSYGSQKRCVLPFHTLKLSA